MKPRHKTSTPRQRARGIALARLSKLNRYRQLREQGLTADFAAARVGSSNVSLWRWGTRLLSGQGRLECLIPLTHLRGRRSTLQQLGIGPAVIEQVRRLRVTRGSAVAAWRAFSRQPECPRELAGYVRRRLANRRALPPCFLQAVRLRGVPLTGFVTDDGGRVFVALPAKQTVEVLRA